MDGLKTFRTIEDNKTGIETMIKNDMDCVYIIRQIPGVQSASDRVSGIVLDRHFYSCLFTGVRGEN
jgi:DNA-binding FrmR family transcriptional regulator